MMAAQPIILITSKNGTEGDAELKSINASAPKSVKDRMRPEKNVIVETIISPGE